MFEHFADQCGRQHDNRHFSDRGGRKERHERWREMMIAMGRGPSGGHGPRGRGPGRDGFDDDDDLGGRGRFLGQGHIRLLVLSLIETEARHGYDLIRQIEEMSGGAYAPSPGVIYPTLTLLEEAGYAATASEGNKKLYAITEEGKAHLEENRDHARRIVERLSALGERMRARAERHGRGRDEGPALPRGVDAAFLNLREAVARRIGKDEATATDIVRKLLALAEGIG